MEQTTINRNRWALWYERTRYPGLALCGLTIVLYSWSLPWGFAIDDWRHVSLCREYREGRRETLGLYRFLASDEENRGLRADGYYPWWVGDDVRYQHLRPLSERMLYAEYLLTGGRPLGYRLVSLSLYCIGLVLALRFLRVISGDVRLARWGTLAFAVAGAHALPVVFISMQCDLLSLVLALGAALAAVQYVSDGGGWRAGVCIALYGLSLGAKESSLPVAVAPLCGWLALGDRPGGRRRACILTGVLTLIGLAWISAYAVGDYGSNTAIILDPIHSPGAYLTALPGRVLLLLSTAIQPINPFIFYLRPRGAVGLYVIGAAAVVALFLVVRMFFRRHRGQRGVASMALWILPFLPLLACTIPDDRNMILPGIGVAFFVGAWITRGANAGGARVERGDHADGASAPPLRRLPMVLFVLGQVPAVFVVSGMFRMMELDCAAHVEGTLAGMGRGPKAGDHVFFVNVSRDWHVLFAQHAMDRRTEGSGLRVSFLSDLESATLTRLNDKSVRIEGGDQAFLDGFLGAMSASRERPKQERQDFDAGDFVVRLERVERGRVLAAVFQFAESLGSEHYFFFECRRNGPPRRLPVPRIGETVRCSW